MTYYSRTRLRLSSQLRFQPLIRIGCEIESYEGSFLKVGLKEIAIVDVDLVSKVELLNLARSGFEKIFSYLVAECCLDSEVFDGRR